MECFFEKVREGHTTVHPILYFVHNSALKSDFRVPTFSFDFTILRVWLFYVYQARKLCS